MKTRLAPALRKETKTITLQVALLTGIMLAVFGILHLVIPEKVPFDYTVILGGICGGAVAVLNFFLMGFTIQKASEASDEAFARKLVGASYTRRMGLQLLWGVAAILAPCFHFAAGLVPLLFPGLAIKLRGILKKS